MERAHPVFVQKDPQPIVRLPHFPPASIFMPAASRQQSTPPARTLTTSPIDLATDRIIVTLDRFVTTAELKRAYRQWSLLRQEQAKISRELTEARNSLKAILKLDANFSEEMQLATSMKNMIICPICRNFMSNIIVRLQECGHVFCHGCIHHWELTLRDGLDEENNNHPRQLMCPLCRKDIFLPVAKEPSLRFFVRFLTMLDTLESEENDQEAQLKSRLYIEVPQETLGISRRRVVPPSDLQSERRNSPAPHAHFPTTRRLRRHSVDVRFIDEEL
ncbi:hypothetical protein CVT26_011179 [Gymnopilus dilepis]|uniref:RING-type domain-containing protein n=1 Tax=Gymnopilus dilepis TaxID=231916 RepID=A0A409VJP9_9AGAR|nr:hypothetical protein CVT26_011179 [Gymnopilus dilepis]